MDIIQNYIDEMKQILDGMSRDRIRQVIEILHEARLDYQQVFIMGNGGSASTASHFVCDLGKNTRVKGVPNFRVMALTDNIAMFSALANDNGYENVFADQLASHVRPGDIVIGISTGGNSPNVINAIRLANSVEAKTFSFTGFNSGQLGSMVQVDLHVPSDSIEHVEDVHLMLGHLITRSLREHAMALVAFNQAIPLVRDMVYREE